MRNYKSIIIPVKCRFIEPEVEKIQKVIVVSQIDNLAEILWISVEQNRGRTPTERGIRWRNRGYDGGFQFPGIG